LRITWTAKRVLKINDKSRSIIVTFRPVVSIPNTESRNREDNITIAMLSTHDRAIRTMKVKSVLVGYRAHVNVNPGIKKTSINPKTARRRERRAATISKGSPNVIWYIPEFMSAGFYIKKSLGTMKTKKIRGPDTFLIFFIYRSSLINLMNKKIRNFFYSRNESLFSLFNAPKAKGYNYLVQSGAARIYPARNRS
jgi:hypothetical protein